MRFVGRPLLALFAVTAAACSSGSSGAGGVDYEVTVTAKSQVIAVYGCPACPTSVNPTGFVGWRERRRLPRVYSVRVNGRRSDCPALTALPRGSGGPVVGKRWNLTVSATGQCMLQP